MVIQNMNVAGHGSSDVPEIFSRSMLFGVNIVTFSKHFQTFKVKCIKT